MTSNAWNLLDCLILYRVNPFVVNEQSGVQRDGSLENGGFKVMGEDRRHFELRILESTTRLNIRSGAVLFV